MNEIIKRNTTEVGHSAPANPFSEYADNASQRAIVGKLLKFSKGDWTAGQDGDDVPNGSRFIANMGEMLVGWQKWEQNKPVAQEMGKVMDRYQPASRKELGDLDREEWEIDAQGKERDPWQKTNYLLFKGEENGQLYTFSTSSKGGLDAVAALCKEYGTQMASHPGEWPVVAIGESSYPHPDKSIGKVKIPTFHIAGWAPKAAFAPVAELPLSDDDDANIDEFPEPVEAPKPAKKNRI